jgi:hypothetical protein
MLQRKKQVVVWFALDDSRPPFGFAGIWTTFNGDRGPKCEPVPERNRSTHLATVLGVVLNWRAGQGRMDNFLKAHTWFGDQLLVELPQPVHRH